MAREERRFPNADPSLSYDLAKNELSILLSSVDALDSKIAFGVSLATTLIAILLAFLGIRTGQEEEVLSAWPIGLVAATGATYLCSLAAFALAFRISSWKIGLGSSDVWDRAEEYRDYVQILYWWATEVFIDDLKYNHQQYRRKQILTSGGFALLAGQFAVGAASLVVTFG